MLSPRTLSLRARNRALLKALDKYTDIITDNTSSNHGFKLDDGKNPGLYESDHGHLASSEVISNVLKHLSEEDLCPRQSLQWQNSYLPRHKSESCINFDGSHHVNHLSSSVLQNEKSFKAPSPLKQSALDSTEDLRSMVHEIISDVKESKPHKTGSLILTRKSSGSRSSFKTPVKSSSAKSISLQQQRAAEAQMHAPTHSHLMSKCSCNNFEKIKSHPDSRYIVQLYGHKQRIPSRLKRQRYRADSIPRQPRTVKWADTDNPILRSSNSKKRDFSPPLQTHRADFKAGGDFFDYRDKASCQVHSDCSESRSSFLDRVRTFRESHWDDCHASPRGEGNCEHECAHHYILNRRLFLEPVHTVNGESSCPVCTLHSNRPEHGPDSGSHRPANRPSKIMVTLPTVLLEDSHSSIKSNSSASVIRKMMRKTKEERGNPS